MNPGRSSERPELDGGELNDLVDDHISKDRVRFVRLESLSVNYLSCACRGGVRVCTSWAASAVPARRSNQPR